MIDRCSNEYCSFVSLQILLCIIYVYMCIARYSLHGRPVNIRDWRRLKVTAAQLSAEVNRVECDWSGHLSLDVVLDVESITNEDESDPPAPYTPDEI
jgi:hypothetical protein